MTGPAYDRHVVDAGAGMVRVLRAALATMVVVGLASGAHTLGGGSAPAPLALAVLAAALAPALWWVTARELTTSRMTGLLGGTQVLVHAALMAMGPGHGSAAAAHVHGAHGLPPAGEPMAMTQLTPAMLALHAAATVATAVVLSRAERVLWWVVSLVRPPLGQRFHGVAGGPVAAGRVLLPLPFRRTRPLGGRAPPLFAG